MIDHVSLHVRDFARSRDFYVAALEPLGYGLLREFEGRDAAIMVRACSAGGTELSGSCSRSRLGLSRTSAIPAW